MKAKRYLQSVVLLLYGFHNLYNDEVA